MVLNKILDIEKRDFDGEGDVENLISEEIEKCWNSEIESPYKWHKITTDKRQWRKSVQWRLNGRW